jgi:hypothetical protein
LSDKGIRGGLSEKTFEEETDQEGIGTRRQGRGAEKEGEEKQGCREDIKEDVKEICQELCQEVGCEKSFQNIDSKGREEDEIKEACFGAEANERCRKSLVHRQEN